MSLSGTVEEVGEIKFTKPSNWKIEYVEGDEKPWKVVSTNNLCKIKSEHYTKEEAELKKENCDFWIEYVIGIGIYSGTGPAPKTSDKKHFEYKFGKDYVPTYYVKVNDHICGCALPQTKAYKVMLWGEGPVTDLMTYDDAREICKRYLKGERDISPTSKEIEEQLIKLMRRAGKPTIIRALLAYYLTRSTGKILDNVLPEDYVPLTEEQTKGLSLEVGEKYLEKLKIEHEEFEQWMGIKTQEDRDKQMMINMLIDPIHTGAKYHEFREWKKSNELDCNANYKDGKVIGYKWQVYKSKK